MKRINILLLSLLLFASCSFKQKADGRIKPYVASFVADPDFSIEEKDCIWDDDSLCIIDFRLRSRNTYGGYEYTNYEYILVHQKNTTYECVINTDKKTSIYSKALNHLRNFDSSQRDGEYEMVLHMIAFDEASQHGRIVE